MEFSRMNSRQRRKLAAIEHNTKLIMDRAYREAVSCDRLFSDLRDRPRDGGTYFPAKRKYTRSELKAVMILALSMGMS